MSTTPSTGYQVPAPERTDGVGMALRRAFGPCRAAHDDFADLLVEVDRAGRRVES